MEDLKYLFSFSGFLNEKILNQEKKGGGDVRHAVKALLRPAQVNTQKRGLAPARATVLMFA